jgi:hypothetical protein
VAIVDEFPPHVWIGPNAAAGWAAAQAADAKARADTDEKVTLGAPIRVQIDGNAAYVVTQASYAFTEKGKKMREQATWTFVLERAPAGWLIRSWSWNGHRPAPAP